MAGSHQRCAQALEANHAGGLTEYCRASSSVRAKPISFWTLHVRQKKRKRERDADKRRERDRDPVVARSPQTARHREEQRPEADHQNGKDAVIRARERLHADQEPSVTARGTVA